MLDKITTYIYIKKKPKNDNIGLMRLRETNFNNSQLITQKTTNYCKTYKKRR